MTVYDAPVLKMLGTILICQACHRPCHRPTAISKKKEKTFFLPNQHVQIQGWQIFKSGIFPNKKNFWKI